MRDTDTKQQQVYYQRLAALTQEQRGRMVGRLTAGVRRLAEAGTRQRHPAASDEEGARAWPCASMGVRSPGALSTRCPTMPPEEPTPGDVLDVAMQVARALSSVGARHSRVVEQLRKFVLLEGEHDLGGPALAGRQGDHAQRRPGQERGTVRAQVL